MERRVILLTFSIFCSYGCGQVVSQSCPFGWHPFQGYCYAFIDQLETWSEAAATCTALGAYLADIESAEENLYLTSHARQYGGDVYWLDGTDMVTESEWIWARTNTPFQYSNWHPGNPNNDRDQDCLCLLKGFNYNWDDDWCSTKGNFICKQSVEVFGDGEVGVIGK